MSLITLLTREPPQICGYTFDAVLEDELEFGVEVPTYPIENGAEVSDHRIILPARYRITIMMTNTPLAQSLGGFAGSMAGGLVSNLTDNPVIAAVAGMSAGFLASSSGTRSSTALEQLIGVMEYGKPFDVQCGDITLKNMVITKITRRKNPENERGLEAVLELQEYVSLDRITQEGAPKHTQMRPDSKEASSCSAVVNKGVSSVKELGSSALDKVKGWF